LLFNIEDEEISKDYNLLEKDSSDFKDFNGEYDIYFLILY
ncbi:5949_t:CDS:1, partial [Funneliformis caledonium]